MKYAIEQEVLQASVFETGLGWLVLAGYCRGDNSSSHYTGDNCTVLRVMFGGSTKREAEACWQEEIDAVLDSQGPSLKVSGEGELVDWYPDCRKKLQEFGRGEPVSFSGVHCGLTGMTSFQQEVLQATRLLTSGDVIAYGELAKQIGRPKASRAVGAALGRNPVPIIIPCHRIVGARGQLTGFTAPGGIELKKRMLQMERCASEK